MTLRPARSVVAGAIVVWPTVSSVAPGETEEASMKVLVLEERVGASCDAALDLVGSGHEVVRCHGADEPAFPCRGITSDACPLDAGDVEVALMVRSDRHDGVGAADDAAADGARCALRRHIPLVVAGEGGTRLEEFASGRIDDPSAVSSMVEMVGRMPSPRHGDVAEGAFAGVLEAHGLDPALAGAIVVRSGSELHVQLVPGGDIDRAVLEVAAVRVAGALRRFDPFPRVIDVVAARP